MADRLLVVANRLPVTIRQTGGRWRTESSSGGLVAALGPVMDRTDGLWIGWPGQMAPGNDADRAAAMAAWEPERRLVAVDLPASVSRAFYEGYSNNTLWPLLHGFPSRVTFNAETFQAYRDANTRFADAVLARHRPGDLVWVHDYQLLLLPQLLRSRLPDARISFFLHVPFPAPEGFRILPQREQILEGMLGADVIGFQTHEHLGAFRRTLLQVLGAESRMDQVELGGRTVRLVAQPIGIVPEPWERLVSEDATVQHRIAEIRARHAGRRLVIAVDRLDYTKGIPERLRAFRHLLISAPEWRGRVSLVQIAVPSREAVPRYAALRREVSELVGEINGEFGGAEWSPVIYVHRSVPRPELAALYAAADVAWVASLRDGMNLVAKEYVACQQDRGGVLMLSEFAGAAGELGEAIRVNPYDETGSAAALERALTMPEDERLERQAALLARVRRNTALAWAEQCVADLESAVAAGGPSTGPAPLVPTPEIRQAFAASGRRLCFLDYDGTLVPLASRPADATPSSAVLEVLAALAATPGTTVVLVSGRSSRDLEQWFGRLEGVWLAAEHGALIRAPGEPAWSPLRPGADSSWKEAMRPVIEHFASRAPGSSVEEKEFAIAWHYRQVEPEFGEWLAGEVADALHQRVAGTELAVLRGSKVIEVRFAWATKGEVAAHVRSVVGPVDLELAIGDDRTDEDMFERLNPDAWTIHVGPGPTRARFRLAQPAGVVALLAALADESSGAD